MHEQQRARAGPVLDLRGRAGVQRGVELRVGDEEGAGARLDVHHHVGLQRRKTAQARHQPARGEGGHRGQRQRPAFALVRHGVERVAFHGLQAAGDLACVGSAAGRERHAVPRAAKQRHAQEGLERADLTRHRALRERQFLRGARVALVARGGVEAYEGLQGRDLAAHVCLDRMNGFERLSMEKREKRLARHSTNTYLGEDSSFA
ncbi:hypothetical protein D9M69_565430 [compost metagenome]